MKSNLSLGAVYLLSVQGMIIRTWPLKMPNILTGDKWVIDRLNSGDKQVKTGGKMLLNLSLGAVYLLSVQEMIIRT